MMIRKMLILIGLLTLEVGSLMAQSPPTLSNLENGSVIYQEGNAAVSLTNTIQVASELPVIRATVRITDNYVPGQDRLVFDDTEDVRGVFDEASGTLFLLSSPAGTVGTAVSFQRALRNVAYQNTDELNPQISPRTIAFRAINESDEPSEVVTRSLEVTAQNDAPRLNLPVSDPIPYSAGSGQNQVVFAGINLTEPDGDMIVSAQVTIREGFNRTEDRLIILSTGSANITATVSNNQRTIDLNGTDTPEAYQTAIRSVQFSNSPPGELMATSGNREITVTVDDGRARSNVAARFVAVSSENIPPVVDPLTKTAVAGTDLEFTSVEFLAQYRDTEGGTPDGIYLRSKPRFGTLLFRGEVVENSNINTSPDGLFIETAAVSELVYRPPTGYQGEDEFQWNATDGDNFAANNAPVVITVTQPPLTLALLVPEPVTTSEDTETLLPPVDLAYNREASVTATLSVANGLLALPSAVVPLLSFGAGDGTNDASVVFSGTAAAVAYALSGLRYLPNENYNGSDELSVGVSAGNEVSDQATLAITVTPNNDPLQLVNLETEPIIYSENDPPVSLTNQIVIENLDRDSELQVASATITITEGYVPGEDLLQFNNTFNITGEQQDNTLVLTGLNNTGVYQEVLRAVTYQNTSDDPSPTKTVSFVLRDELDSTSNTVSRNINIQPVDDPPMLVNLEAIPLTYVLGNDATNISSTIRAVDPDSDLSRAVVSLAEGYDPDTDSLFIDDPGELTAQWNDEQGQLTLSGSADPSDYTQALQQVRYRYTESSTNELPRTLSIRIFDANNTASDAVTRPITLIAENEPPRVIDFSVETSAGSGYVFTQEDFAVAYEDTDQSPVGDSLIQVRILTLPTTGVLLYQGDTVRLDNSDNYVAISDRELANGDLQYISPDNFAGTDAFDWTAFDGAEVAEEPARVQIDVLENLSVRVLPRPDTVCVGATDTLTAEITAGPDEVTYQWSCPSDCNFQGNTDQSTVAVSPTQTTTYTVTVTNTDNPQRAQDSVTVLVADCPDVAVTLDIPSAFTPNGDEANDTWVIPNAAALPGLTVEVFDRYGHSLYRSDNYQNDWDGTYEGESLPVGTYYYVVTNAGSQTYKGALNILR